MNTQDVSGEIEDESEATRVSAADSEEPDGQPASSRGYDKRVVYGGGIALLTVFVGFSFFGGSTRGRPPLAPALVESSPVSSDPPYAAVAPPARGLQGDSSNGTVIPPPSSAVVGGADGRAYTSVGAGMEPAPGGGATAGSAGAAEPGAEGRVPERTEDPRAVAWRAVRDASPASSWSQRDQAVTGFGGQPAAGGEFDSSEVVASKDTVLSPGGDSGDPDARAVHALAPVGRTVLVPALTRIDAALVSAVNSDVPGEVLAQVTRDVLDSSGERIAIPAGTLLLGKQTDQVAVGQRRLVIAWSAMQLPDRTMVPLPGFQAADASGAAGLAGRVSSPAAGAFGRALLLSAIGAGFQMSQPQSPDASVPSAGRSAAAAVGQQLAELSSELLKRDVSIRPTIRLAAGSYVSVLVSTELRVPARNWARTSSRGRTGL